MTRYYVYVSAMNLRVSPFLPAAIAVVSPRVLFAQQDAANIAAKLMNEAAVKAAIEMIRAAEPRTIENQVRICEVEAR